MKKDLFDTNWNEQLQSTDLAVRRDADQSIEVVLLAGLQRLAREAGIVNQDVVIQTPSDQMVQAIFKSQFRLLDGSLITFVGTADCNARNTDGKFLKYPTAVAESRAEARCLRKALGIRLLSSEEIGFMEGVTTLEASPTARAASSLISAIETLCETRGFEPVQVLDQVLEGSRASTIFELSELTTDEAQKAMAWLNEQTPKKTLSKRAARKAELQANQEE